MTDRYALKYKVSKIKDDLDDFDYLQDAGHKVVDIICLTDDVIKTTKEYYDLQHNDSFLNEIDKILSRHISAHTDYNRKKGKIIIATAKLALEVNLYIVKRDEKYKEKLKSTSVALEKAISRFTFEDFTRDFLIEEIKEYLSSEGIQDQHLLQTYQDAENLAGCAENLFPLLQKSLQKQIAYIASKKGRLTTCPKDKRKELKDQLASDLERVLEHEFSIPARTTDESTGGIFEGLIKECCVAAGLKRPGKRPTQTNRKKRKL